MRINIVGLGVGREKAPSTDVWGINELVLWQPVDITFDMHDVPAILSGEKKQKRRTLEKLQRQIKKIKESGSFFYSLEKWSGLPCQKYPIKLVAKKFNTSYFTGSVDYAIALALYEGYDDIHLYGMNYSGSYDYRKQFGGVHYWIGRAEQMGVEVVVHGRERSRVMKTQVYGYDMPQEEFRLWVGL